jgi:ribosomal protein S14
MSLIPAATDGACSACGGRPASIAWLARIMLRELALEGKA